MNKSEKSIGKSEVEEKKRRKLPDIVLTTGQVAKICHISQQTVIRSFDGGVLKGFKVPGSRSRRIPIESLRKLMEESNIPLEWLYSWVNAKETAKARKIKEQADKKAVVNEAAKSNNEQGDATNGENGTEKKKGNGSGAEK